MWRHAESDNLMLLIKKLEFSRVVTFMPIYDQKTICTTRSRLSMLFKVVDPFYAFLIYRLAVVSCGDNPIGW